jgi:hypothetical protein
MKTPMASDGHRRFFVLDFGGHNITSQKQKIAACGSSYRGMRSPVGAAEGCDLLIFSLTQAT